MIAKNFKSRKQIKKEAHGEGVLYKYCRRYAPILMAPRWRKLVDTMPEYSGGLRHRHRVYLTSELLFVVHEEE